MHEHDEQHPETDPSAGLPADGRDVDPSAGLPADGRDVDPSGGSPPDGGCDDIGELLADVERERDEYLELARRTKADFENYRKRIASEATAAEQRGRADLARQLIPVVDNLERALQNITGRRQADDRVVAGTTAQVDGLEPLQEGILLVLSELRGVLERAGIESYEPVGEAFDPEWHEAMMTRPASPDETGKVLEVLEKGYRLNGQVLRPARVVVAAAHEQQPPAGKPADGLSEE